MELKIRPTPPPDPMVSIEHAPLHRCQNYHDGGETKSKVRFSPTILSFAADASFAIGESERRTLWYQPEELQAFKSESRFLCELILNNNARNGDINEKELAFCRGLEHRTCPRRRIDKVKAIKAVLIAQHKLTEERNRARYCNNVENILANVSLKYTASARDVARRTGELDASLSSVAGHDASSCRHLSTTMKRKVRADDDDDVRVTASEDGLTETWLSVKRARTRRRRSPCRVVTTRAA
mmetsp:Transcript_29122/g.35485  ORF Transcript_29122/g.35485 Transcript_29122/m.35485 type:complete len:240 (+) Transcript_29122:63-782(+)